ncbi:Cytochrome P450 9e2 [Orchesella cincta]|uniref:Cytochrome P450 9e2 n=1 Tax=Orchesella cincta TaxID=48709 RepID=A0A1D2M1X5_ORCCI|nr:Cytochrome P450 9e2 [Orchesella cincta]
MWNDVKKTGKSFVGISDLISPTFYIADLELMKNIYIKDFDHFVNRRQFATPDSDLLLKKMMVSLEGERWKGIRSKLSPTFTTGKIRRMFGIFDKSSQLMCEYVKKRVGSAGGEFDICESYSKYTMDVIASCAFGVDSKSFDCEPGVLSEFEKMGERFQFKLNPAQFIKVLVLLIAPKVANKLGLEAFDTEPQKYFSRVIKDVMKRRRETGERRDDFLQLMMDAQKGLLKGEENSKETLEVMTGTDDGSGTAFHSQSEIKFDDDDIVANSVLFLIGGFDTTQSLLIFAAYNLALEQDVQEKLLKEVKASFDANGGKLTYEGVLEMNYLDMVINGMRFALTEVKAVVASLVYNFKLEPGTLTEIPVKFSNTATLKPANGMWLKMTPRIASGE